MRSMHPLLSLLSCLLFLSHHSPLPAYLYPTTQAFFSVRHSAAHLWSVAPFLFALEPRDCGRSIILCLFFIYSLALINYPPQPHFFTQHEDYAARLVWHHFRLALVFLCHRWKHFDPCLVLCRARQQQISQYPMDLEGNPNQVGFLVGFMGSGNTLKMAPSVGPIGHGGLLPVH